MSCSTPKRFARRPLPLCISWHDEQVTPSCSLFAGRLMRVDHLFLRHPSTHRLRMFAGRALPTIHDTPDTPLRLPGFASSLALEPPCRQSHRHALQRESIRLHGNRCTPRRHGRLRTQTLRHRQVLLGVTCPTVGFNRPIDRNARSPSPVAKRRVRSGIRGIGRTARHRARRDHGYSRGEYACFLANLVHSQFFPPQTQKRTRSAEPQPQDDRPNMQVRPMPISARQPHSGRRCGRT